VTINQDDGGTAVPRPPFELASATTSTAAAVGARSLSLRKTASRSAVANGDGRFF
jgi:hypothetical protein